MSHKEKHETDEHRFSKIKYLTFHLLVLCHFCILPWAYLLILRHCQMNLPTTNNKQVILLFIIHTNRKTKQTATKVSCVSYIIHM